MPEFEARNVSEADVSAPRERIWALVSSPSSLADLTPFVAAITPDGDRWWWQMKSISILGVRVEPTFTELMAFEEGRRISFEHQPPPGSTERAGAKGTYVLEDGPGNSTHLKIDITLHVELPLPRISRPAVERVMATTMAKTGDRFARNLYARLGLDPAAVPVGR